jgi:beta-phosphoglucomutase-like phosphatase (HAD superfamily)
MGFNRRKMEDQRRQAAEKEAAARRATDAQVLEDAERLITAWNERQAKRMPMLFSPTIGAAIAAGYWFLWVRCPACRTTNPTKSATPRGLFGGIDLMAAHSWSVSS